MNPLEALIAQLAMLGEPSQPDQNPTMNEEVEQREFERTMKRIREEELRGMEGKDPEVPQVPAPERGNRLAQTMERPTFRSPDRMPSQMGEDEPEARRNMQDILLLRQQWRRDRPGQPLPDMYRLPFDPPGKLGPHPEGPPVGEGPAQGNRLAFVPGPEGGIPAPPEQGNPLSRMMGRLFPPTSPSAADPDLHAQGVMEEVQRLNPRYKPGQRESDMVEERGPPLVSEEEREMSRSSIFDRGLRFGPGDLDKASDDELKGALRETERKSTGLPADLPDDELKRLFEAKQAGRPSLYEAHDIQFKALGLAPQAIGHAIQSVTDSVRRLMQREAGQPFTNDDVRDALIAGPGTLLPGFARMAGGLGVMGGKGGASTADVLKWARDHPEFEKLADGYFKKLQKQRVEQGKETFETVKETGSLAKDPGVQWRNLQDQEKMARLAKAVKQSDLGEAAERAAAWELYTTKGPGGPESTLGVAGGRVKGPAQLPKKPPLPEEVAAFAQQQSQMGLGPMEVREAVRAQFPQAGANLQQIMDIIQPLKERVTPQNVKPLLDELGLVIKNERRAGAAGKKTTYLEVVDPSKPELTKTTIRIPKNEHQGYPVPERMKGRFFDTGRLNVERPASEASGRPAVKAMDIPKWQSFDEKGGAYAELENLAAALRARFGK